MLRLKRLIHHGNSISHAIIGSRIIAHGQDLLVPLPSPLLAQWSTNRFFLDIFKRPNKDEILKERARITDEIKRGYFDDIKEIKQHGGKISLANKVIAPALEAAKFPSLKVEYPDGRTSKFPIVSNGEVANADVLPNLKASVLCLTFREYSQGMINSWSLPLLDTFNASKDVELYQVSFIDTKFLCWKPMKKLLLWTMRSSKPDGSNDALRRQMVYYFGDHYYFRKELGIENLCTGYIFLLDRFGRIRWQGSGMASKEELTSLVSCTSLLLEEK
uniref:AT1G08220-like protein n=1 Tax=Erodium foetidum TaxID=337372 RepID=A0A0G4AMP1_9ROSI|nr:AT1G08220-like protein [Erodium foetidum]